MFPSPLGVSYFQISFEITIDCGEDEFLSPLGVSYFQINEYISNDETAARFPSPLGVSYFQINNQIDAMYDFWNVSVPSRGILFPNKHVTI